MLATFNTDLKPFEDLAASFAAKELAKNIEDHDRYPFSPFFHGILEKAFEVGFLGAVLPEDMGGIGQGISALCVILDNICRKDSSLGGIIFTNALSHEIMLAAGADKAMRGIFPKAKEARDILTAFPSFCNPSQLVNLPRASKSGKGYVLTGSLEYLTLGNIASNALIPARIDESEDYSFFLVNLDLKGIVKSDPVFSLGLHACPVVDVTFGGVKAGLVGEAGKGPAYFNAVSGKMHAAASAMAAGIMKGSFDEALAYSKERFQGGREIINWSEVSMILANMAVKTDVADLLVEGLCRMIEQDGKACTRHCISSSLHIHEIACEVVTDGVQVLGGNGYMKDYGQEKRYRDARQVQALLGIAPLKKISIIREISSRDKASALAA